jgi:hypothetical protein
LGKKPLGGGAEKEYRFHVVFRLGAFRSVTRQQSHLAQGQLMKPDVTPPNGRRRKVLQGTLAAPVVLTVSSASASSVSSFGRCLRNLNGQQTGELFVNKQALSLDTWLRKDVDVFKLQRGDQSAWFYLDRSRAMYVRLSNPTGPGISQMDMMGWRTVDVSKRWMLVWVDGDSGKPSREMKVQRPDGYTATTKSCYSSLIRV